MLSILHPSAKLKLPISGHRHRACARGGPVPRSRRGCDALPSRQATRGPLLRHPMPWEYGNPPGATSLPARRCGWGWFDSPQGGPHGRGSAVLRARTSTGAQRGVALLTEHVPCAWLLLLQAGVYPRDMCYANASRRLRLPGTDLGPLCCGLRTGGFRRRALWSAHRLIYGRAFPQDLLCKSLC